MTHTRLISWKKIKPYQPLNLKNNDSFSISKFRKSLNDNGIIDTFKVFEINSSNKDIFQKREGIYLLDGHLRLMELENMSKTGNEPEEMVEASFIPVKDPNHAKKIISIYNSRYRTIDIDAYMEFIEGMDLNDLFMTVNLDDIGNEILNDISGFDFDSYINKSQEEEKKFSEEIKQKRKEVKEKIEEKNEEIDSEGNNYIILLFKDEESKTEFLQNHKLSEYSEYINGSIIDKIIFKGE